MQWYIFKSHFNCSIIKKNCNILIDFRIHQWRKPSTAWIMNSIGGLPEQVPVVLTTYLKKKKRKTFYKWQRLACKMLHKRKYLWQLMNSNKWSVKYLSYCETYLNVGKPRMFNHLLHVPPLVYIFIPPEKNNSALKPCSVYTDMQKFKA